MAWTLPIIHPAAILRGQFHEEPAQVTYLRRARELFENRWEPPNVQENPPDSLWIPTLETLATFDSQIRVGAWDCLSVDIENAGNYIILLGLTLMNLQAGAVGLSLSLPFRCRYGERYWQNRSDHDRATEYLGDWLANPHLAKLFQNGLAHDIPLLEETGFVVAGEVWDTMTTSHYAYPEMRKGLSYNAALYLGVGNWKVLLDEEDESEGKF